MSARYRIGIDTGGTFTDVVALDESTGAVVTTKTPTTPADPSVGFMNGVRKIREQVGFTADQISGISHGTAIAVCFLHSYADGDHERRMRDVLRRVHPEAAVSISSDVLPEYREYERAVTTLIDAFVKPRVARYVGQIQTRVEDEVSPSVPF